MFNRTFNKKQWWITGISLAVIAALVVGLVSYAAPALAQGGGEPPMRHGNGEGIVFTAVVGATVKVTQVPRADLLRRWIAGETLTDIITAEGKTVAAVTTEAKALVSASLETALSRGRLTQAEADAITAGLDDSINAMLTASYGGMRNNAGRRVAQLGVEAALLKATQDATGLTARELRQQLTAEGATFASVITANGATVEAVTSAAKALITERVNTAVTNGRLTQENADTLLANLDKALETAINSGLPRRMGFGAGMGFGRFDGFGRGRR